MLVPIPLLFLLAATGPAPSCCADEGPGRVQFAAAACTGSATCRVCTNCSRCAHCKGGGTCGVCSSSKAPRASATTSEPTTPPKRPSTRRKPAAPAPATAYATLAEDERRRLYGEYHNAGLLASWEADSRYPLDRLPADQVAAAKVLKQRKALYEARKTTARAALARKYLVATDTVLEVEKEGDEAHWLLPPEPENPFRAKSAGPR